MKAAYVLVALMVSSCLPAIVRAQSPTPKRGAEKSAADVAIEDFFKLRDDKVAIPDQARFHRLIEAGFACFAQYPTHPRLGNIIGALGSFGATMRDKSQAPMRAAWVSQLKYEIVSEKNSDKFNDDGKTAMAALEAAVADYEVREQPNRENVAAFRRKIDALAESPQGGRFLQSQERSYVEVLKYVNANAAEAHLRKLIDHTDKGVAGMAQEELNLVEVRKAPYPLKFTALDGKECDFGQLRGKVVALVFWATTNETSTKELGELKEVYLDYRKRGFEIVTVSYDKTEHRENVVKFVKDNKVAWPVYFDGTEAQNEFGQKLNVRRVPTVALFDQKGILALNGLRANRVRPEVAKMLGIKEPPPEESAPEMGGGGGSRRRR